MPPGTEEYKEILVNRVKTLQRSSHDIKQLWYTHCRKSGSTGFDPNRHDEASLQAFLNSFERDQRGSESSTVNYGSKAALIQKVKDLQRSSPENRRTWYAFCSAQGTPNYDPARHDEAFLRRYVESFEAGALGGARSMAGGKGELSGDGWGGKGSSSSSWGDAGWDGWYGDWGCGWDGAWYGDYGGGACSDWWSKGKGKGATSGCTATASTRMGICTPNRNLSEFGILDVPLSRERLNEKRGASCIETVPSGGLMTEEEAKALQQSFKRQR
mmetsp:Transcript_80765/g.224803  ORF Transcript_80765/g.224803 Transcript_80765/m.224803 type:complete len:271 (-) Transcript_80765:156-968(-)